MEKTLAGDLFEGTSGDALKGAATDANWRRLSFFPISDLIRLGRASAFFSLTQGMGNKLVGLLNVVYIKHETICPSSQKTSLPTNWFRILRRT
jgi:hypothetical protein